MEYKAINPHEMKRWMRIAGLVAGVGLLALSFYMKSIYTGSVGIMIFLAVIYRKEVCFNDDGYLTTFDFIVFKHKDLWGYSQLSDIHREPAPNQAYMGLILQKDMAFKRAIIPVKSVDSILHQAKIANPKIHIGDIN